MRAARLVARLLAPDRFRHQPHLEALDHVVAVRLHPLVQRAALDHAAQRLQHVRVGRGARQAQLGPALRLHAHERVAADQLDAAQPHRLLLHLIELGHEPGRREHELLAAHCLLHAERAPPVDGRLRIGRVVVRQELVGLGRGAAAPRGRARAAKAGRLLARLTPLLSPLLCSGHPRACAPAPRRARRKAIDGARRRARGPSGSQPAVTGERADDEQHERAHAHGCGDGGGAAAAAGALRRAAAAHARAHRPRAPLEHGALQGGARRAWQAFAAPSRRRAVRRAGARGCRGGVPA
mmetsp:Transcript_10734/g.33873  ORF Transcript_10734/g.33873 Transcript_10734/m.33873 type:complete len:295 (+) Transcript_10734:866-1750(+)